MKEVERGKGTEEAGFEDQDEAVEKAGHVVDAMRGIDRHKSDNGGEQEHERAEAIDTEVILDAQRRRPTVQLDEADHSIGGKTDPNDKGHNETNQRSDQRDAARVLAREERDCRADEGQHGEDRQNRKAAGDCVHGRLLQKRMTTRATTPTARMRR